ncbi:hypothetical protein PMAYCL1PPCAC_01839, partial [Pristionchus mayeri]
LLQINHVLSLPDSLLAQSLSNDQQQSVFIPVDFDRRVGFLNECGQTGVDCLESLSGSIDWNPFSDDVGNDVIVVMIRPSFFVGHHRETADEAID